MKLIKQLTDSFRADVDICKLSVVVLLSLHNTIGLHQVFSQPQENRLSNLNWHSQSNFKFDTRKNLGRDNWVIAANGSLGAKWSLCICSLWLILNNFPLSCIDCHYPLQSEAWKKEVILPAPCTHKKFFSAQTPHSYLVLILLEIME